MLACACYCNGHSGFLAGGGEECGRHRSCESRPPKHVEDATEHVPPLASGQAKGRGWRPGTIYHAGVSGSAWVAG